jgi:flagellar motor protein MotB
MDAFQLLMRSAKQAEKAKKKGVKRAASEPVENLRKRSRPHGSAGERLHNAASSQLQVTATEANDSPTTEKQLPDHNQPARARLSTSSNAAQLDVAAIEKFKKAFGRDRLLPKIQNYKRLLVYDLEATCNRARSLAPIEIIEVSCIIVNTETMKMAAEYQAYVKPTEHPVLDPYCVELTGIQQQQVDEARTLDVVLQQHHDWLQSQGVLDGGITHVAVTWTEWDLKVG